MRAPRVLLWTVLSLAAAGCAGPLGMEGRDEQFYYPGGFNWSFLHRFNDGARLFNAFDYGHAVLYERLLRDPRTAGPALDREYRYLVGDLLVQPPRFAIAEEAVMPEYARSMWRAKEMFDWAHVLHRQIYDAYADPGLEPGRRDSLVERLTDYYLTRPDYAFAPVPKDMALMEEQAFSRTFRRAHPRFNGLIWAYHWLQVGLYEPLVTASDTADARAGVDTAVARFRAMVREERYPTVMPMTPAIAPEFSRRHPRAAAIFDNLHMMHDIISDILASPEVPAREKRDSVYRQLDEFRAGDRRIMSDGEWRGMAEHMGGVGAMGGPATGSAEPAPHSPAHQH